MRENPNYFTVALHDAILCWRGFLNMITLHSNFKGSYPLITLSSFPSEIQPYSSQGSVHEM